MSKIRNITRQLVAVPLQRAYGKTFAKLPPMYRHISYVGLAGLAAFSIYHFTKATTSTKHQILPANGPYIGYHTSGPCNLDAVLSFEKMMGEHLDILACSVPFSELQTNSPFPLLTAHNLRDVRTALNLKIEPWKGMGPDDESFKLQDIIDGKFDEEIEAFAEGAIDYDGPVFVTFGPNANSEEFPWHGDPALFAKAYQHIQQVAFKKGAKNITWVMQFSAKGDNNFAQYFPGDFIKWVSYEIVYGGKLDLNKLSNDIEQLGQFNLPIIIEFASTAPEAKTNELIDFIAKTCQEKGINAIIQSTNIREQSAKAENTALPETSTALLKKQIQELPTDDMILTHYGPIDPTGDGERIDLPEEFAPVAYNHVRLEIKEHLEEIEKLKEKQDKNAKDRLLLADHYRRSSVILQRTNLGKISKVNKTKYLDKAIAILENMLADPEKTLFSLPLAHQSRYLYFETLLDLAQTYYMCDPEKGIALAQQAIDETYDQATLNRFEVEEPAKIGYRMRAKYIKARALINKRTQASINEAKQLFIEVAEWADQEGTKNPLILYGKGERQASVLYNGMMSKLFLGKIALAEKDLSFASAYFNSILLWEKSGIEEGGFLDLGFNSLAYLIITEHQLSAESVSAKLPWEIIDGHEDLKKSLQLQDVELLEMEEEARLLAVVNGLQTVDISPELKRKLALIRNHVEGNYYE